MTPQRLALSAVLLAVTALLAVGLLQLSGGSGSDTTVKGSKLTLAQMRARLTGSPAPLASLHAQAGQILPGGLAGLRRRLAALRGTPVVLNKWASWCEPCRSEFGAFQRVSLALGRQVAFIGIDSMDSRANATAFLRSFPISYPSYFDASGQAGLQLADSSFTPVTVFINPHGGEYIHQGPYLQSAKLERDVERYAIG